MYANENNFLSWVHQNICDFCARENCESCQNSEGEFCDTCPSNHFITDNFECVSCFANKTDNATAPFNEINCLECVDMNTCRLCAEGYYRHNFTINETYSVTKCLTCEVIDRQGKCYVNSTIVSRGVEEEVEIE